MYRTDCVDWLTVYLSVRGENPKEHDVRQELVTIIYRERCELY